MRARQDRTADFFTVNGEKKVDKTFFSLFFLETGLDEFGIVKDVM